MKLYPFSKNMIFFFTFSKAIKILEISLQHLID